MSKLRSNIIANYAGSIWGGVISLLVVPLYIKFLGIEAYGLIGFYVSLQILLSLLDMGLGAAVQREVARNTANGSGDKESAGLIKVLEVIYWCFALFIAILIIILAPWLADTWLNVDNLSIEDAKNVIFLMGVAYAFRWPSTLYNGGLIGLGEQVSFNLVKVFTDSLRAFGAVLCLWLIHPTIIVFFVWQIAIEVFNTLLVRHVLWKKFPVKPRHLKIQIIYFKKIWKFSLGLSGISVLAVILLQMDKVVLSKLLSLDEFGYYIVASTLSAGLVLLIRPIFTSIFPKFSQLVINADEINIVRMYHKSAQLMTVVIMPVTVFIAFFSEELLFLWTRDAQIAQQSHAVLSLLIVGTALNGLMNIPYALQLAHGWTRLTFNLNLVAVILLGPLLIFMALKYGAEGAALIWLLLNSGYIFIGVHLMHQRLLRSEKWIWYIKDVAIPIGAILVVIVPAKLIFHMNYQDFVAVLYLFFVLLLAYLAAVFAAPWVRKTILKLFQSIFSGSKKT